MSERKSQAGAVTELLAALAGREDTPVPQGSFSRVTRMLSSALGVGFSAFSGRLRGRGGGGLESVDVGQIRKLVANLGELKGLAMKAGQMPTSPRLESDQWWLG